MGSRSRTNIYRIGYTSFFGGPLLVLGVGVLVVGLFQRNMILVAWAVFAGAIGIYNQIYFYPALPEIWLHSALDLMVGLLTVALGLAVSRQRDWPSPRSPAAEPGW